MGATIGAKQASTDVSVNNKIKQGVCISTYFGNFM